MSNEAYIEAWAQMDDATRKTLLENGIEGPEPDISSTWAYQSYSPDSPDTTMKIISEAPTPDQYDEPAPPQSSPEWIFAADAVLKVLQLISKSITPQHRLSAELLLAAIHRTDDHSQAEIARRYNITRSAVNKRLKELRSGMTGCLSMYGMGGRQVDSTRASIRANEIYAEKREIQNSQPKKPSAFEL